MSGASINPGELLILQQSIDRRGSPEGVRKVLSGSEYRAYLRGADVEIISSLRMRILQGVALPEDFLARPGVADIFDPFSIRDGVIESSNHIAILCASLELMEDTRRWMVGLLARHHRTSEEIISNQLEFSKYRTHLDGPATVSVVEDERGIADQF